MSLIEQGDLLKTINSPADLRKLDRAQLPELCKQLRKFIVDNVSVYGGHFGASLGVVEMTVAMHYVFDTPEDQVVWDVGHQAYGHKILTGEKRISILIVFIKVFQGFQNVLKVNMMLLG